MFLDKTGQLLIPSTAVSYPKSLLLVSQITSAPKLESATMKISLIIYMLHKATSLFSYGEQCELPPVLTCRLQAPKVSQQTNFVAVLATKKIILLYCTENIKKKVIDIRPVCNGNNCPQFFASFRLDQLWLTTDASSPATITSSNIGGEEWVVQTMDVSINSEGQGALFVMFDITETNLVVPPFIFEKFNKVEDKINLCLVIGTEQKNEKICRGVKKEIIIQGTCHGTVIFNPHAMSLYNVQLNKQQENFFVSFI